MKQTLLLLVISLLFIGRQGIYARQVSEEDRTISGLVRDSVGEAIPGASIALAGKTRGTSTKIDGTFTLNVKTGDVLHVSAIGYLPKDITITSAEHYEIVLDEDNQSLNEVVIVGYGTQKKVNLSGAVDQVKAEDLQNRPIANVAQGLQGMVPNLNIRFNSGAPGAAANINIRGITSINGGDPLILIDGVQVSPAELNLLASQDIETMSVIKDASAAAIYGARAAFGVILIKTKTGSVAGATVNYSNNFSLNKPTVIPKMVTDPYIFSRLLELSTDNTPWDNVNYSDQFYQYAKERSDDPSIPGVRVNPADPSLWEYMGDRDWSRYFLDDYNFNQNHDLAISGVSDNNKAQYYLSGGYNRQNSPLTLADDYNDRYSLRAKIDYNLRKWLKIGNNTFYTFTDRTAPTAFFEAPSRSTSTYSTPYNTPFDIYNLYTLFPTSWDKNPDGTWANESVGRMAAQLVDGGATTIKQNMIQSTFTAELSFWDRLLTVNSDFTFRNTTANTNSYQTKYKIGYGPNDVREEGTNAARRGAEFIGYQVFNLYGTLNKSLGKHNLSAIIGYNQENYRDEFYYVTRQDLISSSYPTVGLATGATTGDEEIQTYAIRGAFGRVNYTYDDRYIVEFNGRYDGSSRFPKDKRFGFFPSASAAWRIEQESFMEDFRSTINNLKLRASYGSLGNQNVANYGYLPYMSTSQAGYLIGGNRPTMISPPDLVSPNYTWEKVNTLNFGLDLGFLQDRFTATFDIYKRNTLNMLTFGKDLPDILGAGEPKENAADLQTKGWELSLAYQDKYDVGGSPLNFQARFVLSDSKTHITRFDNPSGSILQYYKGMQLGDIWGLQNNGLFQNTDEITQLDESSIIPWGALQIVPGWPKYVDRDGNGKIEKGYTLDDTKDLTIIGNSTPRYQFGLDLNSSWKNFDIRLFLQGVGKRDYYPIDYTYWGFYQQPYGNTYEHLLDFYRPTSDSEEQRARHSQSYLNAGLADANLNGTYPILQSWLADANLGTRIDDAMGLAIPQTGYLLNASYLRIKNVTIGYTLPTNLIKKIGFARLRIYASGENVFEWSGIKKFYDPESTNANINPDPTVGSGRNGNGMTYPFQRSYSIGVNAIF
ncbi:TonB-dependent receptor [Olivibacter sp. XZL3]|uniref:SusC/RagA family TonB-linked outer membrane protein n=1 Tax=Olivibacter sp. XZL3 TaxID=1735116 RepID=UPI001064751B|nr:TonB-dependent receptor [Olivibacter sp. XZL3]